MALALVTSAGVAHADVFNMSTGQKSVVMLPIGNAGNGADTTSFGAVTYNYNIGKYDITAGQFTEFLNAVAWYDDPHYLYIDSMSTSTGCGIVRTGSYGNYSYTTSKSPDLPVNYVNWAAAARFCNWLQNGQPTHVTQTTGTTETGAYTLGTAFTSEEIATIRRNSGAIWVIPTEDEWYKAAYFNPADSTYFKYATSSNTLPSNSLSSSTNGANFWNNVYTVPNTYLTDVGAFTSSASPFGTFDQNGDLSQWIEGAGYYPGTFRLRGGSWGSVGGNLISTYRFPGDGASISTGDVGFRIVQLAIPEPASLVMLALGGIALLVRHRHPR
jgi:formylglycine-generating enzyme